MTMQSARRPTLAATAVAAVLVLSSCGFNGWGNAVATPAVTTTAPAPTTHSAPAESVSSEQDAAFNEFARTQPWGMRGVPRETWPALAKVICAGFDRGVGTPDAVASLLNNFKYFTLTEALDFVGKSIEIYCPEHTLQAP